MNIDKLHVPRPEFRERLEEEIIRAYRREVRIGATRGPRRHRQLRAAGIIALCIAVGAASGLASAQVRDLVRRDSLVEASSAELALIGLRLELARAQFEEASRKARVGALGLESLAAAEDELRAMETKAARARKNLEEVRASSQPPRDELNAPLVGGRDFVRERIQLDLLAAQREMLAAERVLEEVEKRREVGLTNRLSQQHAELDLTRARAALAVLAERQMLRREFLDRGTPTDQLLRRLEGIQLREDVRVGLEALKVAKSRTEELKRQRSVGNSSELEVMRAEVEVKELELQLHQLNQRRQRLVSARPESVP
jgi:hypothetical protein